MFALLGNLLRPFAYRTIKHPQLDSVRTSTPLFLAGVFTLMLLWLPGNARLVGSDSLASFAFSLLITLPGFFIAALAAIATFNRPEMDLQMPEPTPMVALTTRGQTEDAPLTFRMFIGYIFSYLSIVSLLGAAGVGIANLSNDGFSTLIVDGFDHKTAATMFDVGRVIFTYLVFWLLFDILMATLLGLYFLVERIHRPHS